jgi:putative transport protein
MLPMVASILSPVASAILLYAVAAVLGLALASIKVRGIGIGVTGVLFAGLFLGGLGLEVEPPVLEFVREFGLVLFVFTIGLQLGPGFFASLRSEGLRLNLVAAAIVLTGAVATVAMGALLGIAPAASVGLFSGSTTNTPSLGAAQETIAASGRDDDTVDLPALSYAVAYPIGILGIITTMLVLRRVFGADAVAESRAVAEGRVSPERVPVRKTLVVENRNLDGRTLAEVPGLKESGVVVSRFRPAGDDRVRTALWSTTLHVGDALLAVGTRRGLEEFRIAVGREADDDLSKAPSVVAARRVVVTRKDAVGRTISDLGLEAAFGVVVTRIIRADVEIVASPDQRLKFGDMLQVVGDEEGLAAAVRTLGNSVRELGETNFVPVFAAVALGVLAGTLPVAVPGFPAPLRLGIAGGVLLVSILLGRVGKIGPVLFYVPDTVATAVRDLGMVLFLASIGLKSGHGFVSTVLSPTGLTWIAAACVISTAPLLALGIACRVVLSMNFARLSGLLAGSMTDPPALAFATGMCASDVPAITYATVYPLTMILRIVVAQVLALWLVG